MSDPYQTTVPTSDLTTLAAALDVVDAHAEINHRYRRMLRDARDTLDSSEIRLTQARGIAKKLIVLVRAAGPELRSVLDPTGQQAIDAGLARANELIHGTD